MRDPKSRPYPGERPNMEDVITARQKEAFGSLPEDTTYTLVPNTQLYYFVGTAITCVWKGFFFAFGAFLLIMLMKLLGGGL